MCKLVDESIVTDQLHWAMVSLEQRLINMSLGLLHIECDLEFDDMQVTYMLTVDDYRYLH